MATGMHMQKDTRITMSYRAFLGLQTNKRRIIAALEHPGRKKGDGRIDSAYRIAGVTRGQPLEKAARNLGCTVLDIVMLTLAFPESNQLAKCLREVTPKHHLAGHGAKAISLYLENVCEFGLGPELGSTDNAALVLVSKAYHHMALEQWNVAKWDQAPADVLAACIMGVTNEIADGYARSASVLAAISNTPFVKRMAEIEDLGNVSAAIMGECEGHPDHFVMANVPHEGTDAPTSMQFFRDYWFAAVAADFHNPYMMEETFDPEDWVEQSLCIVKQERHEDLSSQDDGQLKGKKLH
jgi:hypothetical protein